MNPIENEILTNAMKRLRETKGLTMKIMKQELPLKLRGKNRADVMVRIQAPHKEFVLLAEVKQRLTPNTLGAAIHQIKQYPKKGMLVADYVNPQMAERLKEMDIPFMDEAGNTYLNAPPLFIYVKGNKQIHELTKKPTTLAFQTGGLRILFLFLCYPETINLPYRLVADTAGVALGTIGWVVRALKQMNLLIDMGKKRRMLTDKETIVRRWAEAYPEKLRPKLVLGRYKPKNENWWQNAEIDQFEAYWGSEVAAAKLTGYLKPATQTVYLAEKATKFVVQNAIIQDPNGTVEILQAFWKVPDKQPKRDRLVPPLLIYADLLAT